MGKDREEDRRDSASSYEGVLSASIQMNLRLLPNWILDYYRRDCVVLMDDKRFEVMAFVGKMLARNKITRFGVIRAWGREKDFGRC